MDVRLRAIEEADLPALRDWRNSDWLRPYVRGYHLLNMVNQAEWFQRVSTDRTVEMYAIVVNGVLAGVCGLCNVNWRDRHAELSFYLAPGYKEAAPAALELLHREAFHALNLERVWAETYSYRIGHLDLLAEAGYQWEGALRQHVYCDGRYHDSVIQGLLYEEWSCEEK